MSMLAHNVFFTLKDGSPEAVEQMVADCHEYLSGHPGTAFFAAGSLESELARPVNDHDFHVALHVIFESRADHDVYQSHERHNEFVAKNRDGWTNVRVFDSNVS